MELLQKLPVPEDAQGATLPRPGASRAFPSVPTPAEALAYLASFDTFAARPEEGAHYLNDSLRRFLLTLEMVPPAQPGQRLLELGAGPYFLTLLLKKCRGYELSLANFYGDAHAPVGVNTVRSATHGEEHAFAFRNFNAERDPFPYGDASFDVALCCEILEHLTADPTHLLCEAHRVLKPGGLLLVTTPNVHNLVYGLRLLRGSGNIFHPYSCHGIYGRHQREYSLEEVTDLLSGIGYAVVGVRRADIHIYPRRLRLLKRLRPAWRDNLFVLARKEGEPRRYYPPWLYVARR